MQFMNEIASIECPSCGHVLRDYDAAEDWHGILRVTARCHKCRTEHRLEIDRWRGETNVWCTGSKAWAQPT